MSTPLYESMLNHLSTSFLARQASDREFLIRVSYMEIYNEEINDLLAPESLKLQVHENLEACYITDFL